MSESDSMSSLSITLSIIDPKRFERSYCFLWKSSFLVMGRLFFQNTQRAVSWPLIPVKNRLNNHHITFRYQAEKTPRLQLTSFWSDRDRNRAIKFETRRNAPITSETIMTIFKYLSVFIWNYNTILSNFVSRSWSRMLFLILQKVAKKNMLTTNDEIWYVWNYQLVHNVLLLISPM